MAEWLITAPVRKDFDGYGLHFTDGAARTDNERIAQKLARKGYRVTAVGKGRAKKTGGEA